MLSCVQRALISLAFIFFAAAVAPKVFRSAAAPRQQAQQQQAPPKQIPTQQTQAKPAQQTAAPAPQKASQPTQPAQAAPALRTIVLDPGHGGEDTGARGPSGVAEKDVVLQFANDVAGALRGEGFEVVFTRTGDTDPSLDDRDATANAQRDAIFISLHVGSTGTVGTVRTYTYLFPSEPPPAPANPLNAANSEPPPAPPPGFLLWREAQKPFVAQSVKLGDLIQVELTQKFKGSPEISSSAPVAVLRSVAAPAVAVEVSSVAADSSQLESMSADLASCIARAASAYKTIYVPEPQ
jgi:N-acetylmuramoyl-L-alanine amidase